MKQYLIAILFLAATNMSAQIDSAEVFREMGYQAKLDSDYKKSAALYSKVLKLNSNDYDATLALARLQVSLEQYDVALDYYRNLLDNDPQDWEALYGTGNCYLYLDMTGQAITYYRKAVAALPDHVPGYLALAKALSWQGEVDEAINVYEQANRQDSTYSEVWAGIGKMYYWKGKPYTALKFYEKALELDPGNKNIKKEYQQIQKDKLAWVSAQFRYFQETEETYVIDALIQKYSFSKRMSDGFHLNVNTLFDRSDRDFTSEESDTSRWYLNAWVKMSWISEHHRLGVYAGYSTTERLWSAYGLSWQMKYQWGAFGLKNTIDAGYDYFYYWNSVGRNVMNESLQLSWNRWEANATVSMGRIDERPVRSYKGEDYEPGTNPFLIYSLSVKYKILKNPELKIGGQYSFMDYEYQSPLYYSPFERKLSGVSMIMQKKFSKWYFFSGFSYNIGNESYYYLSDHGKDKTESGKVNVDNWSASLEAGYTWPLLSISFSASRFNNPYYENWIAFLNISKSL